MGDPYANSPFYTGQESNHADQFSPYYGDFLPISSPTSPEANSNPSSLAVIEEEKRRRNTAASARFRVKKKEREQVLEKTATEMTDKVRGLEDKVERLELENKWLRGLITEKSRNLGGSKGESSSKKGKGKAEKGDDKRRSPSRRTDGVGTK